jgi:DNA-binding GntR family transcriptional regulator
MEPERADLSLVGAGDGEAEPVQPARHRAQGHGEGVTWVPEGHVPPPRAGQARGTRMPPGEHKKSAVSVLADRLAAALVHHEPGWRLPRHSALARRYSVSTAEIDAAIDELIARHLIRRLADGQLYRASPAEYIIGLEGVPGLSSYVDAMGGEFICRSRQVSWRMPPEDISWALRLPPTEPVCVVRFLWTAGGEPAAFSMTYVPGDIAGRRDAGSSQPLPTVLSLLQVDGTAEGVPVAGVPSALHIELQAPPPSVARSLRLSAGQPAMMVTIRFDDRSLGRPVALTTAVLRAEMFRLVLQSPEPPLPTESMGNLSESWTGPAEDWEP